jgi:phenylacetate-CoA ligase
LVRYNLHDGAALLGWEPLRNAVLASAPRSPLNVDLLRLLQDAQAMPDVIAVSGRTDSCLALGGTKLTEGMLDEAVRCDELRDLLTGAYRASVVFEQERSMLTMDLEFIQGVAPDAIALDRVYHTLIESLGRVQSEFASDWQEVYRKWDNDPSRRVLQLRALSWPALSKDTQQVIKQANLK